MTKSDWIAISAVLISLLTFIYNYCIHKKMNKEKKEKKRKENLTKRLGVKNELEKNKVNILKAFSCDYPDQIERFTDYQKLFKLNQNYIITSSIDVTRKYWDSISNQILDWGMPEFTYVKMVYYMIDDLKRKVDQPLKGKEIIEILINIDAVLERAPYNYIPTHHFPAIKEKMREIFGKNSIA